MNNRRIRDLKLNKFALDNALHGLDIMLKKFEDLDYFESDYAIKKISKDKYTLYFADENTDKDKEVTVSVINENCFLYDAPAAPPATPAHYGIRVLFSNCYYRPCSITPGEYELNCYDRGIFSNRADLIAYKTLDNYLVVIDKIKLEQVFLDNSFSFIIKYGYKYHFDSEKDEYLEKVINGKHVIKERYAIDEYYLELDSEDLLSDDISECLTIIDIDTEMLIY